MPERLPRVSGDREALATAIHNLVDNAVKYSPDSREVGLRARAEGRELQIAVSDRGIGIPEEERRRIFDKFYRARGETARQVKGVGLGLSLVKQIVAAHGGGIECASRPGEGSTFTIRLKTMESA
ncbi:MAG: ATP-binding protein [Acidobacteriota bacterium]